MKLPICNFDAKNAVLCPQCEGKVESGSLSKADVDASIKLANLTKSNQGGANLARSRKGRDDKENRAGLRHLPQNVTS